MNKYILSFLIGVSFLLMKEAYAMNDQNSEEGRPANASVRFRLAADGKAEEPLEITAAAAAAAAEAAAVHLNPAGAGAAAVPSRVYVEVNEIDPWMLQWDSDPKGAIKVKRTRGEQSLTCVLPPQGTIKSSKFGLRKGVVLITYHVFASENGKIHGELHSSDHQEFSEFLHHDRHAFVEFSNNREREVHLSFKNRGDRESTLTVFCRDTRLYGYKRSLNAHLVDVTQVSSAAGAGAGTPLQVIGRSTAVDAPGYLPNDLYAYKRAVGRILNDFFSPPNTHLPTPIQSTVVGYLPTPIPNREELQNLLRLTSSSRVNRVTTLRDMAVWLNFYGEKIECEMDRRIYKTRFVGQYKRDMRDLVRPYKRATWNSFYVEKIHIEPQQIRFSVHLDDNCADYTFPWDTSATKHDSPDRPNPFCCLCDVWYSME